MSHNSCIVLILFLWIMPSDFHAQLMALPCRHGAIQRHVHSKAHIAVPGMRKDHIVVKGHVQCAHNILTQPPLKLVQINELEHKVLWTTLRDRKLIEQRRRQRSPLLHRLRQRTELKSSVWNCF